MPRGRTRKHSPKIEIAIGEVKKRLKKGENTEKSWRQVAFEVAALPNVNMDGKYLDGAFHNGHGMSEEQGKHAKSLKDAWGVKKFQPVTPEKINALLLLLEKELKTRETKDESYFQMIHRLAPDTDLNPGSVISSLFDINKKAYKEKLTDRQKERLDAIRKKAGIVARYSDNQVEKLLEATEAHLTNPKADKSLFRFIEDNAPKHGIKATSAVAMFNTNNKSFRGRSKAHKKRIRNIRLSYEQMLHDLSTRKRLKASMKIPKETMDSALFLFDQMLEEGVNQHLSFDAACDSISNFKFIGSRSLRPKMNYYNGLTKMQKAWAKDIKKRWGIRKREEMTPDRIWKLVNHMKNKIEKGEHKGKKYSDFFNEACDDLDTSSVSLNLRFMEGHPSHQELNEDLRQAIKDVKAASGAYLHLKPEDVNALIEKMEAHVVSEKLKGSASSKAKQLSSKTNIKPEIAKHIFLPGTKMYFARSDEQIERINRVIRSFEETRFSDFVGLKVRELQAKKVKVTGNEMTVKELAGKCENPVWLMLPEIGKRVSVVLRNPFIRDEVLKSEKAKKWLLMRGVLKGKF